MSTAMKLPAELARRHPTEDAFGITRGITTEQAVGFAIAQLETLGEAVPTIRRLRGVIEQKQIEETNRG